MTLSLISNIASLRALRQLGQSTSALQKVFQRLASGQRISSPSDDPAGLAVASKLSADSRVYGRALLNVNDGISAMNVAEGGLQNLSTIVQRQTELAEQAANGSLTTKQRLSLNAEAEALRNEFNRIVATTSYNGINLLGTVNGTLNIHAGTRSTDNVSYGLNSDLKRMVGSNTFTQQTASTSPLGGNAYASGDINGDGNLDVVFAADSGRAFVQWGNGDGTFTNGGIIGRAGGGLLAGLFIVNQIVIDDMDGDGNKDVLLNNGTVVTVLKNTGNKTFSATDFTMVSGMIVGEQITSFTVSDLDRDGVKDIIAVGDSGTGSGSTFINSMLINSNFTAKSALMQVPVNGVGISASGIGSVLSSDFDNDGLMDVFVGTDGGGYILDGLGDGSFGSIKQSISSSNGSFMLSAQLADFNADGLNDLLVAGAGVYLNTAGVYGTQIDLGTTYASNSTDAHAVDVDADGFLDILSADGDGYVRLYRGNGNGTFQAETNAANIGGPLSVARMTADDFDGDGLIDFFASTYNQTGYLWKQNGAYSATQAALDLSTASGARTALTTLSTTLNQLSSALSTIGAGQSRLSTSLGVLQTTKLGYESALSRITDVDMASETANLVRLQILQQAGASVLAQANLQPSLVLQLLR